MRLHVICLALCLCLVSTAGYAVNDVYWFGGTGNWHVSSNWSFRVPRGGDFAYVETGEATFNSTAIPMNLRIAGGDGVATASVVGYADLLVDRSLSVGTSGGTGTNKVESQTGFLTMTNGDVMLASGGMGIGTASGTGTNNNFTGEGTARITDGNVTVFDLINIGYATATSTNNTMRATGELIVERGNVKADSLSVGSGGANGSSDGFGKGTLNVKDGNVFLVNELPNRDTAAHIGVGNVLTQGEGAGEGVVSLTRGDFVTDHLVIGSVINGSLLPQFSIVADGKLFVEDGDVMATKTIVIGTVRTNLGTARGLFEQRRGITTTDTLTLGAGGKIVLGINGPGVGSDYSQIRADDVLLNGILEAKFENYLPQRGDVFDLLVADNIAGAYGLLITGINPSNYPDMQVIQTSNVIRISFVVPEPTGFTLIVLMAIYAVRRRKLSI
jgi:hypothetical protein